MSEPFKYITLKRNGCDHKKCPVYRLKISGDGSVEFFGELNVEKPGSFSWKIPQENMEKLAHLFSDANYFSMNQTYDGEAGTCHPTSSTSIEYYDGKYKSVFHHHANADVPVSLCNLEDKIDEYAQTRNYVKAPRYIYHLELFKKYVIKSSDRASFVNHIVVAKNEDEAFSIIPKGLESDPEFAETEPRERWLISIIGIATERFDSQSKTLLSF